MSEPNYLTDAETVAGVLAARLWKLPASPDIRRELTPAIKLAFCDLCDRLQQAGFPDISCYPDHRFNNREFSCDVSLWEQSNRVAKAVHLEVESELADHWNAVRFDFDKLKKSVANLKALVTRKTCQTRRTHEDFQHKIQDHLTHWSQHIKGHRYLWFEICENSDRSAGVIAIQQWTAPNNDIVSDIRLGRRQDVSFSYLRN